MGSRIYRTSDDPTRSGLLRRVARRSRVSEVNDFWDHADIRRPRQGGGEAAIAPNELDRKNIVQKF